MPIHPSDPTDGSFLEIIKAVLRGDAPQKNKKYKYETRKKRRPPDRQPIPREWASPDMREGLDRQQQEWEDKHPPRNEGPGYSLPKHRYEDASMLRPNQPAMPGMGDQTPTIEDLKALERSMEPHELKPPTELSEEEDLTPFPDLHHRRRMRPPPQMQQMMDDIMEEENRAPPTRPQEDIDQEMREMMDAYENEMGIPIGFKENLLKHGRRSKNVEEAPPMTEEELEEMRDIIKRQTFKETNPDETYQSDNPLESKEEVEAARKHEELWRLKQRSRIPYVQPVPPTWEEYYPYHPFQKFNDQKRYESTPTEGPIPPLKDLIMSLLKQGQQV